jgi:RHS repeat-associated protein
VSGSLSRASRRHPPGQKTTYTYDGLDRVTKITFHDESSISYAYDAVGNVTSMSDNTGTTSYTYDALYRLTKETFPDAKTNSYGYDSAGNLLSFADPGGTVAYVYDAVNRLVTLTEPSGKKTTFTYDVDDMRLTTAYPNGVTLYFSYDAANRITRVLGKKPASGEILTDFTYVWRNAAGADTGLRQSVTDKAGNRTSYSYDALNRLTRAETRNAAGTLLDSFAYAYDANSNRSSQSVNGATTGYSHNAADQLTTAGSVTYSYDGNGNETGHSGGRAWAYNAKDQAVSVTPPGGSALSMSYTGTGQFERVTRGSTSFRTNGLGLGYETTGTTSSYFTRDDGGQLLGMRVGSAAYYYLTDGLGSVAAVTDGYGAVAATYSYEPFGKVKSSTGTLANPYRWLGALGVYLDTATGLYKMGTRYYDPALGRFTQVDPVPGGALNAYDYALQNPVAYLDLDGELVLFVVAVAVGTGLRVAGPRVAVAVASRISGRRIGNYIGRGICRAARQGRLARRTFGYGRGLNRGHVRTGLSQHRGQVFASIRVGTVH